MYIHVIIRNLLSIHYCTLITGLSLLDMEEEPVPTILDS